VLPWLAVATLLLTLADHWTTWLCLRAPVPGWEVREANPLAEWLFARAGLLPGLALDTALTGAAVAFLLGTRRLPDAGKQLCFGVLSLATGLAVLNNLGALRELGLLSWSGATS